MQSSQENSSQQPTADTNLQKDAELSETWHALLGVPASGETGCSSAGDASAQIQPLTSDPWGHLLHARGMQSIDLQKVRLQYPRSTKDDDDIEHALDLMQEASGQPPSWDKKTGEV